MLVRRGRPEKLQGRSMKVEAVVEVEAVVVVGVATVTPARREGSVTRVTFNALSARIMDIMLTNVQGRRREERLITPKWRLSQL